MSRFYLTTAIDYANGDPHIGHAYEKIGADAIARYRRLRGDDVHFLIGMDEHGHKVAQAAEERGLTPQQQVDAVAARFESMWRALAISNDQFIRTTNADHRAGVRALIKRIFDNNPDDFYEKSYNGWYCVGCESFKQESEIVDGKCVLHPTRTLEWVEERNWFFRLSKYQGFLKRLITERPEFVQPDTRRNEMLALLDEGLEDLSASRARLSWGVPFPAPLSTGETQTTYVWFDALPNYLTATGFPAQGYKDRWPAQLHIVGKDINRFHSVIWPALLQAAELPLPDRVWVHGFVLLGGERFSKSAGVKLDLDEAIERFGPDALRYFLLREIPFDTDGSFSWERFEQVYNSELANTWGNLGSRVIAMIEKYFAAVVPEAAETDLDRGDVADITGYHAAMDGSRGFLLHDGIRRALACVVRGNEFVQSSQPWVLARSSDTHGQLETVLGSLARAIARQCVMLFPFVPEKAGALWAQLGAPGRIEDQRFDALMRLDAAGWSVKKGEPLFPRPAATAT
ncbi:MAG TPA: methionine--tRNA ligase [Gemmatimonadaceae bacterium]|nr:methionine--tRNA ligase [Gemmatimonadaceae bacterium]